MGMALQAPASGAAKPAKPAKPANQRKPQARKASAKVKKHKKANPAVSSPTALSPLVSDDCQCSLSVDGLGTNNPAGGPIQVQKNAGATVKAAYLFAASTGFSDYTPVDGDVTLNGNAVSWNAAETINNNISSVNVEADVTSIIAPIVNAASPGLVPITAAEPNNTADIDGEVLAVVFNDPTAPANNSIILLYGAQYTAGDTFNINLGTPIDLSNPDLSVSMGIGDSYSYQPAGQYSTIDVNGQLMTSSAGGQDDCDQKYQATPDWTQCGNGALLTVGGIGDSTANPPDPSATDETCGPADTPPTDVPAAPRCDDELYNLLPFVHTGDTSIQVDTDNPSSDDNIFFASLDLTATSAIVGQGVILSPASATNPVGAPHTLTAKVVDDSGDPVSGQLVNFKITAGPNAGMTGSGTTNASGDATWTYTSTVTGTDTIEASFTNSDGVTFTSNDVTKTWVTGSLSPTTTTTSLSGGGQSGTTISVPSGTPVTDQATLTGADAATASGTITYNVFSDSGCTDPVSSGPAQTFSGDDVPASNPVTLGAGTYYWQAVYSGDSVNAGSKSLCGPGDEVQTVSSSAPPTCVLSSVITGPPKQILVTVQAPSGLSTVNVTNDVNDAVSVAPFTVGDTSPVTVTATKTNQSQVSELALTVTDVDGNSISCDPADFSLTKGPAQDATNLDQGESFVTITNDGLKKVIITVDGVRKTVELASADGLTVLNLQKLFHAGLNDVSVKGIGGGSADVLFAD